MQRWKVRALTLAIVLNVTGGVLADEPVPPPQAVKAAPVVPDAEAFRAATPYNATVVGRPVPNPLYNRPSYTLPCENPNQNFEPLILTRPDCLKRLFGKSGCGSCGKWGKGEHGCGVGNCATCNNTYNFIWGGSRSFFGESSREFFERPAAVDGLRHKWNPPPVIYRAGY
jgi:hypothetical protein